MRRSLERVTFLQAEDARHPYEASVRGERWVVRVNEFPSASTPFSLLVDDEVVEDLMEWPPAWSRPEPELEQASEAAASGDEEDPLERAEYEREVALFARSQGIPPLKLR